jgi:hypothetical protein
MRHVANLKNLLFNKINVFKMKKLLFSALFLTTFSSGLFAKQEVEVPLLDKSISKVNDELLLSKDDVECSSVPIPICEDGVVIGHITMTVCSPNLPDFIEKFDC